MNELIVKILSTSIEGQLQGTDLGGGICIAGSPGIGKTKTMGAIADSLGMKLLQVSIPEVSTENLSGLPDFIDAPHMDKYSITGSSGSKATTWTTPQIVEVANRLATEEGSKGCILFIDDLHRVNMAVAPYLYGLLGERKLGSFMLDQKVAIMGAMNDSDEAGFSGIDSPIKDRIGILPVSFDFDYWFKNFGKQLHFYVSSFLKTHPTYAQEDESTMIEQFGTPRSWTHLANEFDLYELSFLQEHAAFIAKQKVSKAAATELAKHIAYVEAIDFTAKINSKQHINIGSLKPIDQILYAYIINYVESVEDALYIMTMVDTNIDHANFVGFLVGELYTKFLTQQAGKTITKGVRVLIDKMFDYDYDKSKYSTPLTPKEVKLFEAASFTNRSQLMELGGEFIQ